MAKTFRPLLGCSTTSLRALNVAATCLICLVSYAILRLLRAPRSRDTPAGVKNEVRQLGLSDSTIALDANTALNVALFPPLFFFSALFYTDVMSTLVVLLSYGALLRRRTASGNLVENFSAVLIGVVALLFRQTNIFWVAIFPAGLTVIDALKAASSSNSKTTATTTIPDILRESWDNGTIHDCEVQDAGFQGVRVDSCLTLLDLTSPRLCSYAADGCNCGHKKSDAGHKGRISVPCPSRIVRRLRGLEWKCCPWYVSLQENVCQ